MEGGLFDFRYVGCMFQVRGSRRTFDFQLLTFDFRLSTFDFPLF